MPTSLPWQVAFPVRSPLVAGAFRCGRGATNGAVSEARANEHARRRTRVQRGNSHDVNSKQPIVRKEISRLFLTSYCSPWSKVVRYLVGGSERIDTFEACGSLGSK